MGMSKEIAGLLEMMELHKGESLQTVFCGKVYGPSEDLKGRDGIFFTTQLRIGVSAVAGWIEKNAYSSAYYPSVHNIKRASSTTLKVMTAQGAYRIEFDARVERTHDMNVVREYIIRRRNLTCRSNLVHILNEAWELYEKSQFEKSLSCVKTILRKHSQCVPAIILMSHIMEALGKTEYSLSCLLNALNYGEDRGKDILALISARHYTLEKHE